MGYLSEIGNADIFRKRLVVLEVVDELFDRLSDGRFFIETDGLGAFFGALLFDKEGTHVIIIKINEFGILGFNSPQH